MTTTTAVNKQKVMQHVFQAQGKGDKWTEAPARPVLEQFIYAVCREDTTRAAADQAFERLRERFFDWNEVRVSSPRELADVIDEFVSDGEARAQRIVEFLQEVFETTFSFDMEGIEKKGLKQAAKQLTRYQAANDYAVSWVVQKSLGGHSVPLDQRSLRVLRRLNVIEDGPDDLEAIRATLEHQIPKSRGSEFVDILSMRADEHCFDADPACPACPLGKVCPTGQECKMSAVTAGKKPR